ncbi:hypothetical protein NKH18_38355 [Streptomyces sp. M10(2022)]
MLELLQDALRGHDEDPFAAAPADELGEGEAYFEGLAEPDDVRDQDAGRRLPMDRASSAGRCWYGSGSRRKRSARARPRSVCGSGVLRRTASRKRRPRRKWEEVSGTRRVFSGSRSSTVSMPV